MLIFVDDVEKQMSLIKLAELLGQNHGILTLAHLSMTDNVTQFEEQRIDLEAEMRKKIAYHGFQAFCEVYAVNDFHDGFVEIAKGHGLAGLRTNTVLFGWSDTESKQVKELKAIHALRKIGKNIIVCRFTAGLTQRGKRIDIWWGGQQNNGDLMLLLAYLLKLNRQWERANIRILSVVRDKELQLPLKNGIEITLPKTRIVAEVLVMVSDAPFKEILHKNSATSDIVFLGLPKVDNGNATEVARNMDELCHGLQTTIFVQNNSMSHSIPILLKI